MRFSACPFARTLIFINFIEDFVEITDVQLENKNLYTIDFPVINFK
jgi:hypothetical protein